MINADRLFKLLPCFFSDPSTSLVEIAQNSHRARASQLTITLKDNVLTAVDNGRGAKHAEPLFVLADTGWDEETVRDQNPAGFGIFHLVSIATEIIFRSLFGSVTVDATRLLNDKPYRESILGRVNREDTCEGFFVKIVLSDKVDLNLHRAQLKYFPMDITLNGEAVERKHASDGEFIIKTTYKDNFLGIKESILSDVRYYSGSDIENAALPLVIWYGIKIPHERNDCRRSVILDITTGSPLTPVLPFREKMKRDDSWNTFLDFVREQTAEYCVSYINDRSNNNVEDLAKRMKFLSVFGTQEQLNSLSRFYYLQDEPYAGKEWGPSKELVLIGKEEKRALENEVIDLVVDGEQLHEVDTIIALPERAVTERTVCDRRPGWVEVKERTVHIDIDTTDTAGQFQGNYSWAKATISCVGKSVPVVAAIDNWCDGAIYYSLAADDFRNLGLDTFVFEKVRSDEGDSWETQQNSFNEEISDDLQNISGKYQRDDLFKGFWTAKISPWNILGIIWEPGTAHVKIITKDGEKMLNLGNAPIEEAA
ncbi:MAG: hypothetical protein ACHQ0Y_04980 [Thermodesulfovibrionales bacterium]